MASSAGVNWTKRLSWIANVVFHQGVAVVLVYIWTVVFQNYDLDAVATWHVILTSLGFVLLMSEAFMLWAEENVYVLYITRTQKYSIHAILMILSTISVTVGIALKIYDKTRYVGATHFESSHAILGLLTWVLLFLSVILGNLSKYSKSLGSLLRPVWFKLIHNCVGILTFVLGLTTLTLGLYKDAFKFFSKESTVTTAVVAMFLLALWACVRPIVSLYNQFKGVLGK